MFIMRFFRFIKDIILSLGWIGLSLTISAASIAIVISFAFAINVFLVSVLHIHSAFLSGFSLILSFVLYLGIVAWFGWRYLRRKLQI